MRSARCSIAALALVACRASEPAPSAPASNGAGAADASVTYAVAPVVDAAPRAAEDAGAPLVGCQPTPGATRGASCAGREPSCSFEDANVWCWCPQPPASGPAPGVLSSARLVYECGPLRREDGCPVVGAEGLPCKREHRRCEYRRPCASTGSELRDVLVCTKGAWRAEVRAGLCRDDVRPSPRGR